MCGRSGEEETVEGGSDYLFVAHKPEVRLAAQGKDQVWAESNTLKGTRFRKNILAAGWMREKRGGQVLATGRRI